MSSQLKEKGQQQKKEQAPSRELQADFHFNQHIFRTIAYTAAGFGVGMLSSLLFKHKAGMTIFFAGTGAGYGGANFFNELNTFRSKRNTTQINQREGGQSQNRERFERKGEELKGNLQQAKNKLERGVEDVSSKAATQVTQAAKGAEEWGRNLADKASQNFQQKGQRRGGDDDSSDDNKKRDQQQNQNQRRDQDNQRKGQDDHNQQRPEGQNQLNQKREQERQQSLRHDQPQNQNQRRDQDNQRKGQDDHSQQRREGQNQQQGQRKEQDHQENQRKEQDNQRRDQQQNQNQRRDQDSQRKGQDDHSQQRKEGQNQQQGQRREQQSQKREEGSQQHTNIGDIRGDQFTSKVQDKNANTGYQSASQQWEGAQVKRDDKSVHGQGQGPNDQNRTQNKGGQHFQDFKSNPVEAGKKSETHEVKKDYQMNRNKQQQEEMDNKKRAVHGLEQDKHGESVKQGNNMDVNQKSETRQGFQNYKTGVAPSLNKNQVNADL